MIYSLAFFTLVVWLEWQSSVKEKQNTNLYSTISFKDSNTDGLLTVADSNLFLSSEEILPIAQDTNI